MQLSPSARQFLTILATALGVYITFRYLFGLLFPFLAAWVLSGILLGLRNRLEKLYHTSRRTGNFITGVLLVFVTGGLLSCLLLTLYRQAKNLIANYPTYIRLISYKTDSFCRYCDNTLHLTTGTTKDFTTRQLQLLVKKQTENSLINSDSMEYLQNIVQIFTATLITFLATVLLLKDRNKIIRAYHQSSFYARTSRITHSLKMTAFAYLRAEIIIMGIIALLCTIAFLFIKAPYPIVLGIVVAFLDALPLIGSGIILVPWAVYEILTAHPLPGVILIIAYLCCILTREFLEAHLIGSRIGLLPFFMLLAMYVGIRLFGLLGFLFGPAGLLIIMTVAGNTAPETN